MATSSPHPFPTLRWIALIWLVVYLPAYGRAYPLTNFLFLCNLGVTITALAVIVGNRLWVSSQAVAAPVIGIAWGLDAGWKVATGDFLYGGTAYMWDPQYPLFTRILSLYHLAWPLVLLWCLARAGYDRRGWPLQTAIAATSIVIARLATDPAQNVNFAFRDPFFSSQIGPAVVHLVVVVLVLGALAYGLTHRVLLSAFPATISTRTRSGTATRSAPESESA